MDTTLLIEIIAVIVVVYFLIKFIVSPVIKIVIGIIAILLLIFLLQRFFGFDIDKVLSTFGISLNINKWSQSFNWILNPANYYIDQIKNFLLSIWENVPKSIKL